jgi:hypothetical protein
VASNKIKCLEPFPHSLKSAFFPRQQRCLAQEHIEELRKARTLNARRNCAKIPAGPYQRGTSDHAIKDISDVLCAIDLMARSVMKAT